MKLEQVTEIICKEAVPMEWAEDWDNSGVMVGDANWEISKIAVCLDIFPGIMQKAANENIDLVVSHHPFFFTGMKSLDLSAPSGKVIQLAIENRTAIMSLHTNWDNSSSGMNPVLAEKLGLKKIAPFYRKKEEIWGPGATGFTEAPTSLEDFTRTVSQKWDLSWCRSYGDKGMKIEKAALCGGSGGDLWKVAASEQVDVFVTADIKYHQIIDAVNNGLAIVAVDHGEMESNSMEELGKLIQKKTSLPVLYFDDLPLDGFQILL